MALGQLQHLEALFARTGWLSARCESFNAKNAHAIANRTKFRQDTNLYALDTFVVTPMSKPGICGAREHDEQQTIAEAHGISSFSELVNPFASLFTALSPIFGDTTSQALSRLLICGQMRTTTS